MDAYGDDSGSRVEISTRQPFALPYASTGTQQRLQVLACSARASLTCFQVSCTMRAESSGSPIMPVPSDKADAYGSGKTTFFSMIGAPGFSTGGTMKEK